MIYKVSFQYSEMTYCTNLAMADNLDKVHEKYNKYRWHNVTEATYGDLAEAKQKGMPIIEIA